MGSMTGPEPFEIHVPDGDIEDLRRRLAATRLPDELENADWGYGTNRAYLQGLLEAWREEYDWRAHERAMNAYDNRKVTIDDQALHYLHVPREEKLPLLLLSGWPGSFWDFETTIPHLGDFELVVPDMPGCGFSTPLSATRIGYPAAAAMFHRLMTECLGHERYGVFGTDLGALVAQHLAHAYPESVVGLHTTMPLPFEFPVQDPELWGPDEQRQREAVERWVAENGYFHMHVQRPQTVGYLADSPAATAAWVLDKVNSWTDHDGDLEKGYPREQLLTLLSIYWFTNTLGTSARFYAESFRRPWTPVRKGEPLIPPPTAIASYPYESGSFPRRQLEGYFNLQRYTRMDGRGAHFPEIEDPQGLSADITEFFRSLA